MKEVGIDLIFQILQLLLQILLLSCLHRFGVIVRLKYNTQVHAESEMIMMVIDDVDLSEEQRGIFPRHFSRLVFFRPRFVRSFVRPVCGPVC